MIIFSVGILAGLLTGVSVTVFVYECRLIPNIVSLHAEILRRPVDQFPTQSTAGQTSIEVVATYQKPNGEEYQALNRVG